MDREDRYSRPPLPAILGHLQFVGTVRSLGVILEVVVMSEICPYIHKLPLLKQTLILDTHIHIDALLARFRSPDLTGFSAPRSFFQTTGVREEEAWVYLNFVFCLYGD